MNLERVATAIQSGGGMALPVAADLTSDDALVGLLALTRANFGPIDVLVNSAGYAIWKSLETGKRGPGR